MRPRISVRGCVRPSVRPLVRPFVRPSVGRSVRNAFVKIAENGVMQDGVASHVVYRALCEETRVSLLSSKKNLPARLYAYLRVDSTDHQKIGEIIKALRICKQSTQTAFL